MLYLGYLLKTSVLYKNKLSINELSVEIYFKIGFQSEIPYFGIVAKITLRSELDF